MPWQNFVVEVLKATAWPALIAFVVAYFKEPISRLIDRIKKIGIGQAAVECEIRPKEELSVGAAPSPKAGLLEEEKPPAIPPFNSLTPEARKVLKTLWKFQLETSPLGDYKNRFGFRIHPMVVPNEIFKTFNKGRNELSFLGLVTHDIPVKTPFLSQL